MIQNPFDRGYYNSIELREFEFKFVGEGVKIAKNATILGIENIEIGDNVRIDDYVVISAYSGSLTLGNYIHIGAFSYINCAGGVVLSDFSGLSQGVKIYSSTDDYSGDSLTNPMIPKEYLNLKIEKVTLGKHAIIGAGSIVLPGITINEGVAVGALSLVNKNLDPWGVYFGSPAKFLKSRSKKLLDLEKLFIHNNKTKSL